jgi:hypothetical protein
MRDFGGILLRAGEYFLDRYNPGDAKIRFDASLDRVTGSDPSMTDYILEAAAKCPEVTFSKRL